jgi:hypothetical protein
MLRTMTSRTLLTAPLLVLVLALGACGSDDSGGGSTTGSGAATTATQTTGTDASKAAEDCRTAANEISDATARQTALDACDKLDQAGSKVETALSEAKQKCIDAANKIPVDSLKDDALNACEQIP